MIEGIILTHCLLFCAAGLLCLRWFGLIGITLVVAGLLSTLALSGGIVISSGLFVSNYGNVFYAAVTFLIGVMCVRFPHVTAFRLLAPIVVALLFRYFFRWNIGDVPVSPGNEEYRAALAVVIRPEWRVALGSLAALCAAQAINICVIRETTSKFGLAVTLVIGAAVCQIADSLIFFNIAFPDTTLRFMLSGYLLKIGLAACCSLFFYPVLRKIRADV